MIRDGLFRWIVTCMSTTSSENLPGVDRVIEAADRMKESYIECDRQRRALASTLRGVREVVGQARTLMARGKYPEAFDLLRSVSESDENR